MGYGDQTAQSAFIGIENRLIESGRYGVLFSLERQQETLAELRSLGLHGAADAVEGVLPHIWTMPCPLIAEAMPHLVNEWHDEMAAKKREHEAKHSPQDKVSCAGGTQPRPGAS